MLALFISLALVISQGSPLAQLDMGKLKGEPSRLAWSPDGSQIYLQTLEGGFGRPNVKLRHYVFNLANGAKEDLQVEPEWASKYWTAKSGQTSPDGPLLKIELKTEQRREQTTSVPRGGDLARGGTSIDTGTSVGDGVAAAYNSQATAVHLMLLKGETVGEFVNSVIVPGLTFGWGPQGSRLIAFAAQKTGRVIVMDEQGAKQEVAGSQDAILPAWSADGSRLAWLQKEGRGKFVLQVARVSSS
jgi:dipeptidyl aminopeptidase/acylaminoacyl peptidase